MLSTGGVVDMIEAEVALSQETVSVLEVMFEQNSSHFAALLGSGDCTAIYI